VASKLITNPSGGITGWSFADGSGVSSDFRIHATNFKISDGTTGYTPFSIAGSNVKFNGVVDFTSTNTYGATTIDGSKITTGSITAGQIAANTITSSKLTTGIALINGEVKSSDFTTIGGAGFRLKSNAAGTSADPTIYGAYIRGGTLDGTTVSVRDLLIITDGGLPTESIISGLSTISGVASNTITFNFPIYGPSDAANSNRAAGASSKFLFVGLPMTILSYSVESSGISGYSLVSYNGYTLLAYSNYPSLQSYSISVNGVSSGNRSSTSSATFAINGLTFVYEYKTLGDNEYGCFYVKSLNGAVSTWSGGLSIVIYNSYGFGEVYDSTCVTYNI